jgi:hypothetical protein
MHQGKMQRDLIVVGMIAALVSGIDAFAGRVLHAHPDPAPLLALIVAFWAAMYLAIPRRITAGAVLLGGGVALLYLATYSGWAAALAGWNGSVQWQPTVQGFNWLLGAGVVGAIAGDFKRARKASIRQG